LLRARKLLARIYSENLNQQDKADHHKKIMKELSKGTIYIVSGLPRSGTSMMMQMLEAGGMEIFTDSKRIPDNNNPRGYYEHEAVKAIARDKSWLPQAEGKTVKIIAQLLQHLPLSYNYKIIFMDRDMDEIIISQQKMLGKKQDTLPLQLISAFEKTLSIINAWVQISTNIEMIRINYKDVVENPEESLENICTFLNLQLDRDGMAESVSSDLYRNKK
jgi:hypothetical protein